LAEQGFQVTGIDASCALIGEARRKQKTSKTDVDFIVADICQPLPNTIVDGILCRGVLNDLTDDTSRQMVFPSFASILRKNGLLILDVREWHATAARKTEHPVFEKEVETERGQLSFRSVTKLQPETRILVVSETHQIQSPDRSEHATFTFTMRCWTREELEARLTVAGFDFVRYFGDYDLSKPLGSGDRIVAVASLGK